MTNGNEKEAEGDEEEQESVLSTTHRLNLRMRIKISVVLDSKLATLFSSYALEKQMQNKQLRSLGSHLGRYIHGGGKRGTVKHYFVPLQ